MFQHLFVGLGTKGIATRSKDATVLVAPGLTTSNKKLLGTKGIATTVGARMLPVAPGLTTSNKKLLGTKGIATTLGARTLPVAPGLTTSNKKLLVAKGIATSNKKLLEKLGGFWLRPSKPSERLHIAERHHKRANLHERLNKLSSMCSLLGSLFALHLEHHYVFLCSYFPFFPTSYLSK